ncbi:MAG TPA: hypothetical protein VNM37_21960, partial [Candidatus Dormibacteraeota bacterium]|nr:hypothetical protein [Candidatus Dormibacteraeota bacterium]
GQLLSGQGGGQGFSLGGNTNLDLSGGGATGGYGLGNAASGLGGLQGLLGLVQGAQSGNPVGILQGLQGAYGGITGALGVSPIASLIAQYAPALGSALTGIAGTGGAIGSGAAGAVTAGAGGAAAAAPAVSAALSGIGGAAAPIIAGIVSYLGAMEEKRAREAGYANNPIAGALNSAATQGVGQDLGLLDQIKQGGGFGAVPTDQLEQMLPQLVNQLGPYFSTAQGPKGPIRASDALTGMFGRPGLGGTEQYTQNENQAQQGVMDLVNELMGRGVTYEQLGQLPVSGNFVQQTMDMYNPLQDLYAGRKAEYDTAASPLLQSARQGAQQMLDPQEAMHMAAQGLNPATFGWQQDAQGNWVTSGLYNNATPENLFAAAQGSAPLAPDAKTHASGLITSMYGGPLWAALARMGGQSSPFWGQIQQHFNPWATVGGFSPQQLNTAMDPILQQLATAQQAQEAAFSSAGPTSGSGE